MAAGTRVTGRFVVTVADEATLLMRGVDSAQVLTVTDPTDLERWTVVDATLVHADALGLTMRAASIDHQFMVQVVEQEERPTSRSRSVVTSLDAGASTFLPRQDAGGTDVIALADADHIAARRTMAADLEPLVMRAARLDVRRVELRSAPGILSVRYLP